MHDRRRTTAHPSRKKIKVGTGRTCQGWCGPYGRREAPAARLARGPSTWPPGRLSYPSCVNSRLPVGCRLRRIGGRPPAIRPPQLIQECIQPTASFAARFARLVLHGVDDRLHHRRALRGDASRREPPPTSEAKSSGQWQQEQPTLAPTRFFETRRSTRLERGPSFKF